MKEIELKSKFNPYYLIEAHLKLVVFLTVLLVFVLGYFIVISSQIEQYVESRNVKLKQVNLENENLTKKLSAYKKNFIKSFISQEENKFIEMAVPTGYDFTSVISQITSLAKAYNFKVLSVEADKVSDAKALKSTIKKVRISATVYGGQYDEFKKLLSGMEKSAMIFDIESLNFTSNDTYQIQLIAYYFE